jgi:hypothetical protein
MHSLLQPLCSYVGSTFCSLLLRSEAVQSLDVISFNCSCRCQVDPQTLLRARLLPLQGQISVSKGRKMLIVRNLGHEALRYTVRKLCLNKNIRFLHKGFLSEPSEVLRVLGTGSCLSRLRCSGSWVLVSYPVESRMCRAVRLG